MLTHQYLFHVMRAHATILHVMSIFIPRTLSLKRSTRRNKGHTHERQNEENLTE